AWNEKESVRPRRQRGELCNPAAKFSPSREDRHRVFRSSAVPLFSRAGRPEYLSACVWWRKYESARLRIEKSSGDCRSCLLEKRPPAAARAFGRVWSAPGANLRRYQV